MIDPSRSISAVILIAALATWSVAEAQRGPTPAQRIALLEERMEALESKTDSPAATAQVLDLSMRLDQLEREMRELRGEIERMTHEMEGLGRRQRELYLDLDRRLQVIESGRSSGVPAPQPPRSGTQSGEAAGGDERAEYDSAFRMLQEGRYAAAIDAFKNHLERYPGGRFADNAQYWLGEAYYVTRDYRTALAEFMKVRTEYPQSQKIPDAMLKIGYVHYELQQWDEARQVLTEVAQRVPGTTIARLAEQRLQRMRQEGR